MPLVRTVSPALSLMLLLAVTLGTGCAPRDNATTAGKIKLTVALGTQLDEIRAFKQILADFNQAHPDVVVQPIFIGGNYYDKVKVMLAGNRPTDLMWMGQGFAMFATRGAFLPLDDLYGHINPDDYYAEVLDWYRFDGKLQGFPFGVDLGFIAYNKDLFDDARVPYPTENWTVDEFLDMAKKLTQDTDGDGRIDQYGYMGSLDQGTFGDSILNKDQTRCTLDTPESARLLQLNVDLRLKYNVSPPRENELNSMGGAEVPFLMGRIAMWQAYTWNLPMLRRKIDSFDWDIAFMPIGTQRAHWASSSGFAVSRTTKHPREAVELLKVLASPEMAFRMGGTSLPVKRDAAERMASQWQGPPQHYPYLLEMTRYMHPTPRIPNLYEILDIQYRNTDFAHLGKKTPEECLREAAREINAILQQQRRDKP